MALETVTASYGWLKERHENDTSVFIPGIAPNGSESKPIYIDANGQTQECGVLDTQLKNALTFGSKTYNGSSAQEIKASDLGLIGAMVFLGISTSPITDGGTEQPTINKTAIDTKNLQAGNVVLCDGQEFVWANSKWELLGDEGSHALKTIKIVGDGTVLTGGGTLEANRTISHAKKYGSTDTTAKYTSANNTTSITGSTSSVASGTIKIPQLKVDEYGHVISASDEEVTIKMPDFSAINEDIAILNDKTYFIEPTTDEDKKNGITRILNHVEIGQSLDVNTIKMADSQFIFSGPPDANGDADMIAKITASGIESTNFIGDARVNKPEHHYTPTKSSTLSADAKDATSNAVWNSTNIVTGVDIEKDSRGHVTGLKVDSIKMPASPTTLISVTNTGEGNAVTSGSYNNGAITLTKGSNFKTKQSAEVKTPTSTTGNASSFVDSITQNTNGDISYTKKNVQITIDATATDDDVVILTATDGTNAVTYDAKHAKKGPASGYTSGNTTTSISGSAASGTIKVPQITVDEYGHVTAASDESVAITMPNLADLEHKTQNINKTKTTSTLTHFEDNVTIDGILDINAIKLNKDSYSFADSNNNVITTINANGVTATNFNGKVNNKTINGSVLKDVPADAVFTDTHYQAKLIAGNATTSKTNTASTNGNTRLNIVENDTVRSHNLIKGTGITTVTSDANGVISVDTSTAATQSAAGLMSANDKKKLDGIASSANNYSLPVATSSVLGGIKSGTDITIDSSGNVSVNDDSHNHVISNIDNLQTTLNGKQATITGGASTITSNNLTASRALVSDSSGKVAVSAVTSTELGYLDGVTSAVQTQLNNLGTRATALETKTQYIKDVNTSTGYTNFLNNVSVAKKLEVGEGFVLNDDEFTFCDNPDASGDAEIIARINADGITATNFIGDGRVNKVAHHYIPAKSKTISASSSASAGSWGTTSLVTGIEMDAAGHVTGVTSAKLPANPDTGVTSVELTGDGPALNSASISGRKLTLTKGVSHLYLTKIKDVSTDNETQLVFGPSTVANQHIALSSNDNALVINPNVDSAENQIVLYLNKHSVFPNGVAEGTNHTISESATYSHVEGQNNTVSGIRAHAEGYDTKAIGNNSHAEGYDTKAIGNNSHVEGNRTTASGSNSHAEGTNSIALGSSSHAEGGGSLSSITLTGAANATTYTYTSANLLASNKYYIITDGQAVLITSYNTTNKTITVEKTLSSSAINSKTFKYSPYGAFGSYSHAEGHYPKAYGESSHAEGHGALAQEKYSHAEGYNTTASKDAAHAEGYLTTASGYYSHAEGSNTTASKETAHAEGYKTAASGTSAHAEGSNTTASNNCAHAEGYLTTASGYSSHAGGVGTVAKGYATTAIGKYNFHEGLDDNTYAFVIGNGSAEVRSNAFFVDWAGNTEATGTIRGTAVHGAVWNDYAEFRQLKEEQETPPYGRVVIENGDDSLSLSTDRLQPGGNICSDTFGFAIGETRQATMPIAVSGRVLAYPAEDRNSYCAGDAVCTGPNGTVSKMTREEIREWPDRIIGYVSAIPNYETWGQNNVSVDGRIWIKVI